jgi:hypothetical protein
MAMPALKIPAVDGSASVMDAATLPELAEADFIHQVLQVTTDNSVAVLDELLIKAASLGIAASRPSTALSADKHHLASPSGADSSITLDTNHARSASTGSHTSTSTTLTSAPSHDDVPEPAGSVPTRKRSRNLTFSQYDKYLAQVSPNLDQPKFLSLPPPAADRHQSSPSLFSVSTRKSYLGIRNGLTKLRRKKKTDPFPEPALMFVGLFPGFYLSSPFSFHPSSLFPLSYTSGR